MEIFTSAKRQSARVTCAECGQVARYVIEGGSHVKITHDHGRGFIVVYLDIHG